MKAYHRNSLSRIVNESLPEPFLELTDERIGNIKNYSDVVMAVLSTATILTMTIVAPNAIQALKMFERRNKKIRTSQKEQKRKILKTFYYLSSKDYIEISQQGDDYEVKITEKGKIQIKKLNFETMQIQHPTAWDGKFWQIAIDIPVKRKTAADHLREKLKELYCYPLQKSLWFYPHDPRGEIEFIGRIYDVSGYITFMKVEYLEKEDEKLLVNYFRSLKVV